MNKRELYEQIMRSVSIEVKKALNESEMNGNFNFENNDSTLEDICNQMEDIWNEEVRFEEMDEEEQEIRLRNKYINKAWKGMLEEFEMRNIEMPAKYQADAFEYFKNMYINAVNEATD